ncbi:MAG: response regulator [Elusimicrobiota bacterium]|nr:response regulator [Elusimicrobiota bacterium]
MSARVLAVEDTPALRALLQLCLTRAGYAVVLAEDGGAAVEMFLAGEFDAVVMDIQMPVLDGLAAVARMREWEKGQNRAPVPMLALTANTEPGDLRRCLEAGFTATVRKPFGLEDLLAAVARELGARPAPAGDDRILIAADPEFADLIPPFLDNCRREASAMRRALERGDYKEIAAASHKLTGAGASFGFQPLSDESRRIEAAAKSADPAGVKAHLEAIGLYLDKVKVIYP